MKNEASEHICSDCGCKLADGGPVGLYCPNMDCKEEISQAASFFRQHRLNQLRVKISEMNQADRDELAKWMALKGAVKCEKCGDIGVCATPFGLVNKDTPSNRKCDCLPWEPVAQPVAQCCMCGKKDLSTAEDGGPECELHDGRWVCSSDCWERAYPATPARTCANNAQVADEDAEILAFLRDNENETSAYVMQTERAAARFEALIAENKRLHGTATTLAPVSTATGDRSEIDRLVAILRTGKHGADISNKAADWIETLAHAEFETVMKLTATPAPVEAGLIERLNNMDLASLDDMATRDDAVTALRAQSAPVADEVRK